MESSLTGEVEEIRGEAQEVRDEIEGMKEVMWEEEQARKVWTEQWEKEWNQYAH